MNCLVGFTGFVGSNLALSNKFDVLVNSKNVSDAFEQEFNLAVYAGIRAKKYFANQYPEYDKQQILDVIENIKRIKTK